MKVIRLDALIFSMDEYVTLRDWAEKFSSMFAVKMPAGTAFAGLSEIIFSPNILNSDADGILIADHRKYSHQVIETVIRTLEDRNKSLFSASNEFFPLIGSASMRDLKQHYVRRAKYADTPLIRVLYKCRPALRWLSAHEPIIEVPDAYKKPLGRLERLGFVFRRNNRTYSIRRQRLRKVLEHESRMLSFDYDLADVLDLAKTG